MRPSFGQVVGIMEILLEGNLSEKYVLLLHCTCTRMLFVVLDGLTHSLC